MTRLSMEDEAKARKDELLRLAQIADCLLAEGKVCEAYVEMTESKPGIGHTAALSLIQLAIGGASCDGS